MFKNLIVFSLIVLASCNFNELENEFGSYHNSNLNVEDKKISICHYDEKNNTWHTIEISINAWPAHQAHGDLKGSCDIAFEAQICEQIWMVRNLDVSYYRNGDPIPQVQSMDELNNATSGAWCYYAFNEEYGKKYGKLYNWHAVNDIRGLSPKGWRIPSYDDWEILSECLGGWEIAGGKMKEEGTVNWASPNEGATNESGFTALPGGAGLPFWALGEDGYFWSSTELNDDAAFYRTLFHTSGVLDLSLDPKNAFYSVRCLKE